MHDVLRVLRERTQAQSQPGRRDDGYRVALAIEGGGMRGTVSAGMALALDELGLVPAFDADAATGQSTDLRPLTATPAELRLALRASAALPLLAGPPVELAGRRFYDAGLSESVPYRTALAQGATHVLVLRSRRDPVIVPDGRAPARSVRLLARTTLRRESPALRAIFLARDTRRATDDSLLADYQSALATLPVTSEADAVAAVFSIRPPAGSPVVSRLATDGRLLREAFESGRSATQAAFAP
jgi:predicted acylesterase/phospholipase RssA